MTDAEIDEALLKSLEDGRLSRGERQSLQAIAGPLDEAERDRWRHRAFQMVAGRLETPGAAPLLEWLEAADRALSPRSQPETSIDSEAYFSPKDDCAGRIIRVLDGIKARADICVFTITDDRISQAILRAHDRGVALRIISDDQKGEDLGSDIARLARAGIPVRTDRSEYHMHHKYMVADQSRLLTGSYNWTRGASEYNQENILITNDPKLIASYARAFESLWGALGARP